MMEGRVIQGRYRLVSKLGQGGMGSVWRAVHLELGTPVAVKLIDPSVADSKVALARFKREAQSAASLRGTNVVQILDYGIDDAVPYIAMELLEGESLAARLSQKAPLSPKETSQILSQVGKALARAHAQSIVHRDLKPDNIFIVRDGDEEVTKVLDFGIAKTMSSQAFEASIQTKSGAVLGTPHYMSPEQAAGRSTVDHRADIWSFGVIAFECLTGCRPFNGSTLGGLVVAICTEPIPVPSRMANVPRGFDDWFSQCVCREQAGRFQGILDAVAALRAICEPSERHGSAEPQWEQCSREVTLQNNSLRAPSLRTPSGEDENPGKSAVPSVQGEAPETVSGSSRTLGTGQRKRGSVAAYVALALVLLGGAVASAIGYARRGGAAAAASAAPSEMAVLAAPSVAATPAPSLLSAPEPPEAVTPPLVIEANPTKTGPALRSTSAAPKGGEVVPPSPIAAVPLATTASPAALAPVAAPAAEKVPAATEPATRPDPAPVEVPTPPRRRNVEDRLAF